LAVTVVRERDELDHEHEHGLTEAAGSTQKDRANWREARGVGKRLYKKREELYER
jgi:hypothetical protein